MGIVLAILCMSLSAAIGILMLVLACGYNKFETTKGACWIIFIVFFYIFVPAPVIIMQRLRRILKAITKNESLNEWAKGNKAAIIEAGFAANCLLFFTSGMIVSSFAFPVIMARAQIIKWGAVGAVMAGNLFIFGTMAAFFKRLDEGHSHEVLLLKIDLKKYSNGRRAIFAMLKEMGLQKASHHSSTSV